MPSFCLRVLLVAFSALALWLPGHVCLAQSEAEKAHVLDLLRKGGEAMVHGDLAGAETFFQQSVKAAPDFSDAYLGLGLAQVRRGELEAATKALSRATDLNPRLPGAHLYLGIAQYQMGDAAHALQSLRAETALQPSSVEALTWLGIVELNQNHPELATGPLDSAVALSPKDQQVLYYDARAHMLVAESAYRRLSELDPNSALVRRGMAESFEIAGQTEKAIAEYEAAIQREPANPDLYEALGEANLKFSRIDAARQAFEQELKLNPYSAVAMYNLGRLDIEHGNPSSGLALLRKAEAAHASPAPTDFYLGLALSQLGQNAEAVHWLERSLENNPSPFIAQGAYFQLAHVYRKLHRDQDAQRAVTQLTRLKAEAAKAVRLPTDPQQGMAGGAVPEPEL